MIERSRSRPCPRAVAPRSRLRTCTPSSTPLYRRQLPWSSRRPSSSHATSRSGPSDLQRHLARCWWGKMMWRSSWSPLRARDVVVGRAPLLCATPFPSCPPSFACVRSLLVASDAFYARCFCAPMCSVLGVIVSCFASSMFLWWILRCFFNGVASRILRSSMAQLDKARKVFDRNV
jgi:hypothetical protein